MPPVSSRRAQVRARSSGTLAPETLLNSLLVPLVRKRSEITELEELPRLAAGSRSPKLEINDKTKLSFACTEFPLS